MDNTKESERMEQSMHSQIKGQLESSIHSINGQTSTSPQMNAVSLNKDRKLTYQRDDIVKSTILENQEAQVKSNLASTYWPSFRKECGILQDREEVREYLRGAFFFRMIDFTQPIFTQVGNFVRFGQTQPRQINSSIYVTNHRCSVVRQYFDSEKQYRTEVNNEFIQDLKSVQIRSESYPWYYLDYFEKPIIRVADFVFGTLPVVLSLILLCVLFAWMTTFRASSSQLGWRVTIYILFGFVFLARIVTFVFSLVAMVIFLTRQNHPSLKIRKFAFFVVLEILTLFFFIGTTALVIVAQFGTVVSGFFLLAFTTFFYIINRTLYRPTYQNIYPAIVTLYYGDTNEFADSTVMLSFRQENEFKLKLYALIGGFMGFFLGLFLSIKAYYNQQNHYQSLGELSTHRNRKQIVFLRMKDAVRLRELLMQIKDDVRTYHDINLAEYAIHQPNLQASLTQSQQKKFIPKEIPSVKQHIHQENLSDEIRKHSESEEEVEFAEEEKKIEEKNPTDSDQDQDHSEIETEKEKDGSEDENREFEHEIGTDEDQNSEQENTHVESEKENNRQDESEEEVEEKEVEEKVEEEEEVEEKVEEEEEVEEKVEEKEEEKQTDDEKNSTQQNSENDDMKEDSEYEIQNQSPEIEDSPTSPLKSTPKSLSTIQNSMNQTNEFDVSQEIDNINISELQNEEGEEDLGSWD